MATIIGTRSTLNTNTSNKTRDVSKDFVYYQPYRFPISTYGLLNDSASSPTFGDRTKFEWFEREDVSRETTCGGFASGGTTKTGITVAANIFRLGDTVFFPDTTFGAGQVGIIYGVNTGAGTVDIRLIPSATAATWGTVSASATIRVLASAYADGYTTKPESLTNTEVRVEGRCQMMLDALEMTGRQQAAEPFTGKDWDSQMMFKLEEFRKYKEEMIIYNNLWTDDTTNDITTSTGMRGGITVNVKYTAGTLDEDKINDTIEAATQYDDGDLICWCGGTYFKAINKALKNATTYNVNSLPGNQYLKVYGTLHTSGTDNHFLDYYSPFGRVTYMLNPILRGAVYGGAAIYCNPKHLKFRYAQDDSEGSRRWRVVPDLTKNGTGGRKDIMFSDEGMQIEADKKHAWHIIT